MNDLPIITEEGQTKVDKGQMMRLIIITAEGFWQLSISYLGHQQGSLELHSMQKYM